MKEKFIYERGKGLRRSKVLETKNESSEKFIYGRGKGMRGKGDEGVSCSSVSTDEGAERGAIYRRF